MYAWHWCQCVLSAAILFWLNCKSVYGYWQNQRKLLNEEVDMYISCSGTVLVAALTFVGAAGN